MSHGDNITGYLRLGIPREPQQYKVVKIDLLGRPHPSSITQTTDNTFGEKERGNQIHTRYYPSTPRHPRRRLYIHFRREFDSTRARDETIAQIPNSGQASAKLNTKRNIGERSRQAYFEAQTSDSEGEKSETVVFAGNLVRYPTKTVSGGMHVRAHRGISHVFSTVVAE